MSTQNATLHFSSAGLDRARKVLRVIELISEATDELDQVVRLLRPALEKAVVVPAKTRPNLRVVK